MKFKCSYIETNRHRDNSTYRDKANFYLFKVNKRNTRKSCEICSKLTIKTPKRCQ